MRSDRDNIKPGYYQRLYESRMQSKFNKNLNMSASSGMPRSSILMRYIDKPRFMKLMETMSKQLQQGDERWIGSFQSVLKLIHKTASQAGYKVEKPDIYKHIYKPETVPTKAPKQKESFYKCLDVLEICSESNIPDMISYTTQVLFDVIEEYYKASLFAVPENYKEGAIRAGTSTNIPNWSSKISQPSNLPEHLHSIIDDFNNRDHSELMHRRYQKKLSEMSHEDIDKIVGHLDNHYYQGNTAKNIFGLLKSKTSSFDNSIHESLKTNPHSLALSGLLALHSDALKNNSEISHNDSGVLTTHQLLDVKPKNGQHSWIDKAFMHLDNNFKKKEPLRMNTTGNNARAGLAKYLKKRI